MSNNTVFNLRGVSFGYEPSRLVLRDLDFTVRKGDFVGVIGPNGAGKSTLLHLLSGWLKPASGEVFFQGREMAAYSRAELAREIAVVPQREEWAFPYTVEEAALMGRYPHRKGMLGFDGEEDVRIAREAIAAAGLAGFENRLLQQLSGGEGQRVLMARALAQQAPVLLLDEPTASLDLGCQRRIFSLLDDLNAREGATIVAVSHDIQLAALYCRELVLLSEGGIRSRGPAGTLLDERLLSECYGAPLRIRQNPEGEWTVNLIK